MADLTGGCTCGAVRYRLNSQPMFVQACHCCWCQRLSGGAFAINALIESDRVELLAAQPDTIKIASPSGAGQDIARCPTCKVAVWSHYLAMGTGVRFVRVGTLDDPDGLPPVLHIFTSSKQAWLALPDGATYVPEFYRWADHWPPEALTRLAAVTGRGSC
jgi:hypothetical protein